VDRWRVIRRRGSDSPPQIIGLYLAPSHRHARTTWTRAVPPAKLTRRAFPFPSPSGPDLYCSGHAGLRKWRTCRSLFVRLLWFITNITNTNRASRRLWPAVECRRPATTLAFDGTTLTGDSPDIGSCLYLSQCCQWAGRYHLQRQPTEPTIPTLSRWIYSADPFIASPGPALEELRGFIIIVDKLTQSASRTLHTYRITVVTDHGRPVVPPFDYAQLDTVIATVLFSKDIDVLRGSAQVLKYPNTAGKEILAKILHGTDDDGWKSVTDLTEENNRLWKVLRLVPYAKIGAPLAWSDTFAYLQGRYLTDCRSVAPTQDFSSRVPPSAGWAWRADSTKEYDTQTFAAVGVGVPLTDIASRVFGEGDHVEGVRFTILVDEADRISKQTEGPWLFVEAKTAPSIAGNPTALIGFELGSDHTVRSVQRPGPCVN